MDLSSLISTLSLNMYLIAAFNSFMTQVAQARLDGDRDKDKALIAETMKLLGNSSYSKLITNKENHHDIVYVDESEIGAEIMDEHTLFMNSSLFLFDQ